LLKNCLDKIMDGKGETSDLEYMEKLGAVMKGTSRCGLGQTSPNPILTTIKNFKPVYEAVIKEQEAGMEPTFDIKAALKDGEDAAGRKSVIFN
jgi:[NiFe] hydrogenase diaphorase moiety large subunit